jgi:hypothetical protein
MFTNNVNIVCHGTIAEKFFNHPEHSIVYSKFNR